MSSYVANAWSWPRDTVTWSFRGDSAFAAELREAFAAWDRVISLDFVEVSNGNGADISASFGYIDGKGSTLGYTTTSYLPGPKEITSAKIVFDSSENWVWSNSAGSHRLADGTLFSTVALHEIGHTIGLGHPSDPDVLMYHRTNGNAPDLTEWDIFGARQIYGPEENETVASQVVQQFEPLSYIASYSDLITAFGPDAAAGKAHYEQHGQFEGRQVTFDDLEYIASYSDLINAFGANSAAGSTHYIGNGFSEGRHTTFDSLQYIASHVDLLVALGADADAGATHYIWNGFHENRASDTFDAERYLANYADLRAAFGNDADLATMHYIGTGFFEGRVDEFIL